ncbi:MAG: M6 family metalloprotease domain-containing protein [Muribaculaceae bacterium]|nr:M6 family metalloprotease domain-containing protein [Muribaculaceae bacterium]
MKKQVLAAAVAFGLAGALTAHAVPAKRGFRDIVQPDGTVVKAEQRGDESFHYFMSEQGVPMVRDAEGLMQYVALDKSGELLFTRVTAANKGARKAPIKDAGDFDTNAVLEALQTRNKAMRAQAQGSLPQSGMGRFTGNFPRTGDIPALVILVEYQDVKFTLKDPAQYFGDMINKEGFNEYGGTGCANEYFIKQSGGKFRPKFEVFGPVTLPNKRSYYGGNSYGGDKAAEDMVVHAAKLLDDQVDFSKYDLDNDGKVDNIFIFYAGQGEASYGPAESVWPHSWDLSQVGKAFKLDGKTIDRYACTNEWEQNRPDGVGTFIHEFSHVMGLPDLYHTQGDALYTPDCWSVMDYGPYNNDGCTPPNYSAFERNAMGWIDPVLLDGPATITLNEIGDNNECCLIQTEKSTEFFLLENRQQKGWDAYIPGHGMLIWHIDFVQNVFDRNVVNNTQSHQYVDIVEAGGVANSQNTSTLASYSWPGTRKKTSFTSSTSPALKSWAGKGIDVPITDIAENNGVITFNVCGGKIELDRVAGLNATGKGDGSADLRWNAVPNAIGYKLNLYTKDAAGQPDVYVLDNFYTTGTSYTAEHLKSETDYYLTVTACAGQNESEASEELSFTMPELAWEFTSPQTLPTEDYDESGFTANWEALEGAVAYILNVEAETDGGESTELTEFGSNDTMSLPQGWNWTGTGVYTSNSVGYFGTSAPSLKFSATNQNLTTDINPYEIINVEWWQRGANSSAQNKLTLEGRADATDTWSTIYFCNPSTTAETVTVKNMPSGVHQLRFVFGKVTGNLAFDDLKITVKSLGTSPLEGYVDKNVGNTESHKVVFGDFKPTSCYFTVKAVDADGKMSTVSDRRRVSRMDNTGITAPEGGVNGISISGLTITYTAASGEMMRVYNMAGMLVASAMTNAAGTASVELPAAGLYIISTATGATKVSVR